MDKTQIRTRIQNNWPLYTAVFLVTLVMRYFCRTNDTDTLIWILAPTVRWARILGGISFEYLPHQGYVNHGYQFLVAASCSGSRFMLLTFLMLVFMPAGTREKGKRSKCGRLLFSMSWAYLCTVFVNGIRIVLSVRVPIMLEELHLMEGWLTPDRLHTLLGTVTYFTSLCVIYWCAASNTGNIRLLVPVFWYLLIVLVLPLSKRIWRNEWAGFGEYAVLIAGVCMAVGTVFSGLVLTDTKPADRMK